MSTNALIGIEQEDGSFSVIYNHWDGYPEHLGTILEDHFTEFDQVVALISGGDVSFIGGQDDIRYYAHRSQWDESRGAKDDPWDQVKPASLSEEAYLVMAEESDAEYIYTFRKNEVDGTWYWETKPF